MSGLFSNVLSEISLNFGIIAGVDLNVKNPLAFNAGSVSVTVGALVYIVPDLEMATPLAPLK